MSSSSGASTTEKPEGAEPTLSFFWFPGRWKRSCALLSSPLPSFCYCQMKYELRIQVCVGGYSWWRSTRCSLSPEEDIVQLLLPYPTPNCLRIMKMNLQASLVDDSKDPPPRKSCVSVYMCAHVRVAACGWLSVFTNYPPLYFQRQETGECPPRTPHPRAGLIH